MGALILPRQFTAQPQQAVPVDWSNPLTLGLASVIQGATGLLDQVNGQTWSVAGVPPKQQATQFGIALDTTAAAGVLYNTARVNVNAGSTTQFAFFESVTASSGNNAGFISISRQSGADNQATLQFDGTGTGVKVWFQAQSNALALTPAGLLNTGSKTFAVVSNATSASTQTGSVYYESGSQIYSLKSDSAPFFSVGAPFVADVNPAFIVFGERTLSPGLATQGRLIIYAAWSRALSDKEILAVRQNPWQLFKATPRRLWVAGPAVQLLRPGSDITAGTWTPSSGASLFATLNEAVASDATFDLTSQASTFEVGMTAGTSPFVTTGHVVRYRIVGAVTVSLRQGTTTIASWSQAPAAMTTYVQTLTSVQAAAITNYAALKLQFQAT